MKFDRGPRFFQEEYMGYDNFRSAVENTKIRVNNAIADDLELMGVSDDVVTSIMGRARETANRPNYTSGEEFIDIIKDELEFNDITNYDLEFYKKYFKELESLMRKPKPRFAYGGMI
jgi:vacuolar-type H+-ATPase subunit C/Vma6